MNWRELIENAYRIRNGEHTCIPKFLSPASTDSIAATELALDLEFPSELKDLLSETNGVRESMQDQEIWIDIGWLLWTVDEIEKENIWYRSDEARKAYDRSFDDLLFFAGAGADGMLFAFTVSSGLIERPDIYVWDPIDGTVNTIAPSLETFIGQWIKGDLTV